MWHIVWFVLVFLIVLFIYELNDLIYELHDTIEEDLLPYDATKIYDSEGWYEP